MPDVFMFCVFSFVAFVGFTLGWFLRTEYETSRNKNKSIGTIVLHADGNEIVATTLELNRDILDRNDGEIVYMKIEFRQYSETNKGFNAVVNN